MPALCMYDPDSKTIRLISEAFPAFFLNPDGVPLEVSTIEGTPLEVVNPDGTSLEVATVAGYPLAVDIDSDSSLLDISHALRIIEPFHHHTHNGETWSF